MRMCRWTTTTWSVRRISGGSSYGRQNRAFITWGGPLKLWHHLTRLAINLDHFGVEDTDQAEDLAFDGATALNANVKLIDMPSVEPITGWFFFCRSNATLY
jgi:hypothetical protein